MKLRIVVAAVLTAAVLLFCGVPALAVTAEEETIIPDLVFYRAKHTDTFEGEIDIRGGKGKVTGVEVKAGEDPAFFLSGFDDDLAYFDSLYKSAEQTLTVTRDGKEYEVVSNLAVYDRVELSQDKGSVTLTVKDNRTLKPISNAEYSLYRGGKRIEDGLVSDGNGKITVTGLESGNYELRPSAAPEGYQATAKSVPFTIGGLELAGGEVAIRTTAGKKITADSNELLIAGKYSPDVQITASKETQISSIGVTLLNYGAELEKPGKALKKTFSGAKEAEDFINQEKNSGNICGSVEITYSLKFEAGRSTCNFIQYLEAQTVSKPTAAPAQTPSNNQSTNSNTYPNSGGNQHSVQSATPSPTPTPTPTPAPKAPAAYGTVTAYTVCKGKPLPGILLELIGRTSTGTGVNKTYLTNADGMIFIDKVPEGDYTLTVIENETTEIYHIPYQERVTVGAGADSSVKMEFDLLTGSISGTVADPDGEPLNNATVALYSLSDRAVQENLSSKVKSAQEEEDISRQTFYNAANADDIAVTDESGDFTFSDVEIGDYEIMPLVSGGYFSSGITSCSVTGEENMEAEITVETTRVSITYLGKHEGKLTGRTVTLNDAARTTWVTSKEPMVLKGLVPGEYALSVQSEEGKEDIEPYSFTVPESSEEVTLEIKTDASSGETDIPKLKEEKKPQEKEETKETTGQTWIILGVLAVLAAGAVAFLIFTLAKKKKPEKGGIK